VINPIGQAFDPNLHEALTVIAVESPEEDGMVVQVFSAGYRVGSKLLKPAGVVIGKHEGSDS
jgi:molecular chaperone GrpE